MLFRSDTKANWLAKDPVLGDGEFVIEKDSKLYKIGDGVSKYSALEYGGAELDDELDPNTASDTKAASAGVVARKIAQVEQKLDQIPEDFDLSGINEQIDKVSQAISVYNVTACHPLSSGYYLPQSARLAVPSAYRKVGLRITYQVSDSTWITESFIGAESALNSDSSTTCWSVC